VTIRVTIEDLETGEQETKDVPAGDYFLITVDPCHESGIQMYPMKGTHVLTIKNVRPK
jgi:hypothetical protein